MTLQKLNSATVETFKVQSEGLSGLKTMIGVVLLLASHNLDAINDVALLLPDLSVIETLRHVLEQVILVAETILEALGSGFLGFGLIDKLKKFLKGLLV